MQRTPQINTEKRTVIMHVVHDLSREGVQTWLLNTLQKFPDPSTEHVIVSLWDDNPMQKDFEALPNIREVITLNFPKCTYPVQLTRNNPKIKKLRSIKPDIVHGLSIKGSMFYAAHSDLYDNPPAFIVGGNDPHLMHEEFTRHKSAEDKQLNLRYLESFKEVCTEKASTVMCLSQAIVDSLKTLGFDEKKLSLNTWGIDTNRFKMDEAARDKMRKELGIAENAIVIGSTLRHEPEKDLHTFVRAAVQLVKSSGLDGSKLKFIFAGNFTDGGKMQEMIREAGLSDYTILLGPRDDIDKIYNVMDIGASTSIAEPLGLVVPEYQASGVPVVVTDVGVMRQLVYDKNYLIQPGDDDNLAKCWEALIRLKQDTPEQFEKLRENARQHIVEHFSDSDAISRFADLCSTLKSGRRELDWRRGTTADLGRVIN